MRRSGGSIHTSMKLEVAMSLLTCLDTAHRHRRYEVAAGSPCRSGRAASEKIVPAACRRVMRRQGATGLLGGRPATLKVRCGFHGEIVISHPQKNAEGLGLS